MFTVQIEISVPRVPPPPLWAVPKGQLFQSESQTYVRYIFFFCIFFLYLNWFTSIGYFVHGNYYHFIPNYVLTIAYEFTTLIATAK
jgi:hypothetical protein